MARNFNFKQPLAKLLMLITSDFGSWKENEVAGLVVFSQ